MDGVIVTPKSTTSHPTAMSAPFTALANASPPARPSRPTASLGRRVCSTNCDPNAAANLLATIGVIDAPTMPRAPEIESMNGASEACIDMEVRKVAEVGGA